ncbi:hypothetical protein ES332_D04G031400v1, partial [Gossypium tomentosum]
GFPFSRSFFKFPTKTHFSNFVFIFFNIWLHQSISSKVTPPQYAGSHYRLAPFTSLFHLQCQIMDCSFARCLKLRIVLGMIHQHIYNNILRISPHLAHEYNWLAGNFSHFLLQNS